MTPAEFAEVKAAVLTMFLAMGGGIGIQAVCLMALEVSLGRTILISIAWMAGIFTLFYAGAFH